MQILTTLIRAVIRKPLAKMGLTLEFTSTLERQKEAIRHEADHKASIDFKYKNGRSIAQYFDCFEIATRHITFNSKEEKEFVHHYGRECIYYLVCDRKDYPRINQVSPRMINVLRQKYMGYSCNIPYVKIITKNTFEEIERGSVKAMVTLLSAIINKHGLRPEQGNDEKVA